jgi:hypothetical protein
MDETKKCNKCCKHKTLDKFSKRMVSTTGQSWCKACMSDYQREWNKRNNKKKRFLTASWKARNPKRTKEFARGTHLKSHYGITNAQYEQLLEDQNHVCKICKQPETTKAQRRLHVDHDHNSGIVRGILCHGCNTGLGAFKDKPEILIAAAHYLRRFLKKKDF